MIYICILSLPHLYLYTCIPLSTAQCVAVCGSVLQRVWQCVAAVCGNVLQPAYLHQWLNNAPDFEQLTLGVWELFNMCVFSYTHIYTYMYI